MTIGNDPSSVSGRVLPAKRPMRPAAVALKGEAFGALTTIATEVGQYLRVREQERTKREQIASYRALEVEKLQKAEKVLERYFEQSFEERATSLTKLFDHLESAIESGNNEAMRTALGGIVEIARTSPLASAGDFGAIRAAFDDPNHVWSF